MKTTLKFNLLFDFYGPLLTNRQRDIYQMYYGEDLSLGEIGEQLGISRQAVYDNIKRSSKILADYESKLGLLNKYFAQQDMLKQAQQELTAFYQFLKNDDDDQNQIAKIKNILDLINKIQTES